ncbi:MAG: UPF0182 family protein [Gemmatimonadetes bacterium]|nr:UPF0182 family protein [Gemmatimonadota bacterium]
MRPSRRAIGGFLVASAVLAIGHLLSSAIAADRLAVVGGVAESVASRRWLDVLIRLGTGLTMALAVFASLLAIRRSIVAVVVPRQLGNLIIGEAVPGGLVTLVALAGAVVTGLVAAGMPSDLLTVQFALRPLVTGEIDPYLGRDLGFYWAWLPFERWLLGRLTIVWSVVTIVTGLVYASTSSIRLGIGGAWIAPFARRHLGLLVGLGILLLGWAWRIDRFDLLVSTVEPFGLTAHRLLAPAYRLLAWAAWPLAAMFVMATWRGHVVIAVASALLVGGAGPIARLLLPALAERRLTSSEQAARDASYRRIADGYTARQLDDSSRFAIASRPGTATDGSTPPDVLIAVGAGRYAVVRDSSIGAAGARFDRMLDRVVFAWALRAPGLVGHVGGSGSRLVAPRDPSERVRSIVPFVAAVAAPRWLEGDGLGPRWAIDLVVAATHYPMVQRTDWDGAEARYLRRAGVAYVDGNTGAVVFAWADMPDPILRRWREIVPEPFDGPMALTPVEAVLWAGNPQAIAVDSTSRRAEDSVASPAGASARDAALRSAFEALVTARRRGDWRAALEAEARLARLIGRGAE